MSATYIWQIEAKYGVKNYSRWHLVPAYFEFQMGKRDFEEKLWKING